MNKIIAMNTRSSVVIAEGEFLRINPHTVYESKNFSFCSAIISHSDSSSYFIHYLGIPGNHPQHSTLGLLITRQIQQISEILNQMTPPIHTTLITGPYSQHTDSLKGLLSQHSQITHIKSEFSQFNISVFNQKIDVTEASNPL
jgi:hypothetical protein